MKHFGSTVLEQLRRLDDLAHHDTWIARTSTGIKLIICLTLIVLVTSLERYEIARLLPFLALVLVFSFFAHASFNDVLLRFVSTLPLILGFGLFNLFFDRYGLEALISLTLKSFICVTAGFTLIATSGIQNIAASLRKARLPESLCTQLVIMWSYLAILFEEMSRIWRAYSLRAPRQRGVEKKWWGSLAGQALLRSQERSHRVFAAMQMRGFDGSYPVLEKKQLGFAEAISAVLVILVMLGLRFIDPRPLGAFIAQVMV